MQLSLITPIQFLEYSRMLSGRFCIATLAERYEHYCNWFVVQQKLNGNVILDNGIFEADPITAEQLIEVARIIQPEVLICPDIINAPAKDNFECAKDFVTAYRTRVFPDDGAISTNDTHVSDLMFVPQCEKNNLKGLGMIIDEFIQNDTFQWLGICRDVCSHAFKQYTQTDDQELNRFYFGGWLQRTGLYKELVAKGKKIHYLGVGDQIHMIQHYWYVDSMDTASFFWQAMLGNTVSDDGILATELKRPYNYFYWNEEEMHANLDPVAFKQTLRHNCYSAQIYAQKAEMLKRQILGGRL